MMLVASAIAAISTLLVQTATAPTEDTWLPDEIEPLWAFYVDRLADPDSEIVREAITMDQFIAHAVELALENGRAEEDALSAIEKEDLRLATWNSHWWGSQTLGVTCDAAIYDADWQHARWTTRSAFGLSHTSTDREYEFRRNRATRAYVTRYNLIIIAAPDHPLTDACHISQGDDEPWADERFDRETDRELEALWTLER